MSDLRPEDLTADHFNHLTPTQAELLALLSEECGEVVQIVGKILRHGLSSCHPDGGFPNYRLLEGEIGDFLAATRLIASAGMIDMARVEDAADAKLRKVFKYLHHSSPPASEEKVTCPNCLQQVLGELEHWHSGYHDDDCTVEPHYVCEQQISELDDRHNRMASPEYQAKVKADMNRRAAEIVVDRLVGISAFPVGNCPTCGELVAPWNKHARYEGGYACQPAQPEPAATEMPEAVRNAIQTLRSEGDGCDPAGISFANFHRQADALESFWRDHIAQPVTPPLAMSEELERVLAGAKSSADRDERNGFPQSAEWMRDAIAAVRQQFNQATAPKVVKMEKVREFIALMRPYSPPGSYSYALYCEALAELDG